MNNNQIVDLILPVSIDKAKAKQELNEKYENRYSDSDLFIKDGWLENNAREYLKELEEILNSQPEYDREFWEKVIELNEENFKNVSIQMKFSAYYDFKKIYFNNNVKENNNKSTSYFDLRELDLINKQYRLLQEIYYSRLEGKNNE